MNSIPWQNLKAYIECRNRSDERWIGIGGGDFDRDDHSALSLHATNYDHAQNILFEKWDAPYFDNYDSIGSNKDFPDDLSKEFIELLRREALYDFITEAYVDISHRTWYYLEEIISYDWNQVRSVYLRGHQNKFDISAKQILLDIYELIRIAMELDKEYRYVRVLFYY